MCFLLQYMYEKENRKKVSRQLGREEIDSGEYDSQQTHSQREWHVGVSDRFASQYREYHSADYPHANE